MAGDEIQGSFVIVDLRPWLDWKNGAGRGIPPVRLGGTGSPGVTRSLPDPLVGRRFVLDGEVAADVARAEVALARFEESGAALAGGDGIARLLLRAEAMASSRIEGLVIGGRRLLRAAAARRLGDSPWDPTANEVLGNVEAMEWGIAAVSPGGKITGEAVLEAHRRLVAGTGIEEHGGALRRVQNWIGGSFHSPCFADFVPPPPEAVPELLEDLWAFCNEDTLPAVAQAAVAHARFETIHPFVDGNGRTGRVLIHMVLRRRGFGRRALPPVSVILATLVDDYVRGLVGTRQVEPVETSEAHAGCDYWIEFFANACRRAVEDAHRFAERVRALQSAWRARIGPVRSDSAAARLVETLPAAPVLTAATAATLVERSFQATTLAMNRLVDAGVLVQVSVGRRNRAFEAPELIEAFNALERRLAIPAPDTRLAPSSRTPRIP